MMTRTVFLITCHLWAFLLGGILDLIIGDPHSIPHPVVFIGKLIHLFDEKLQKKAEKKVEGTGREDERRRAATNEMEKAAASGIKESGSARQKKAAALSKLKRRYGLLMVICVCLFTVLVTGCLLILFYSIHPALGIILEAIMTCQILAARSLRDESMKVYDRLINGSLDEARKAVSMIVGRDTSVLDAAGVTRAAVETVAENTSDGVIAPMLYTAAGGPALGFFYKAVNTMDSMVGYKNEKYLDFGRAAAKLDDIVNYIPSRLSALYMILACCFPGKNYSAKGAMKIWKRDRRKHASPNSAQTESVMAGALGLCLGGDAKYFGKVVKKPKIGDPVREIVPEDIRRANHLMFAASFLFFATCLLILWLVR